MPRYRVHVRRFKDFEGHPFWIWRIVNSLGHIVGESVQRYSSAARARIMAKQIMRNVDFVWSDDAK